MTSTNEIVRRVLAEATHRKGGGSKGQEGAKGQDTGGNSHPINVARKAIGMRKSVEYTHENGGKSHFTQALSHKIISHYGSLQKPAEKEEMVHHVMHSPEKMHRYLSGNKKSEPEKGPWKPGQSVPSHLKI